MTYASRAGTKLEYALHTFNISVADLVCADFGSNTGGFVDCLLQAGAAQVYAVETGYGVLDWGLRNDGRVIVMERTNAMHVVLPEKVNLITIDTSWTKLEHIAPNALNNLQPNGQLVALVKPHYEAGPKLLRKGKLPEQFIPEILDQVKHSLQAMGLEVLGEAESPILGAKGKNIEYLMYMRVSKAKVT